MQVDIVDDIADDHRIASGRIPRHPVTILLQHLDHKACSCCSVVDLTLRSAGKKGVPVVILCDTSHRIEREGAQTLVFDKGADSVDFALVNRVKPGDLVVTQDYGLASMCLAKCARVLNQNGLEYTADNIDALMLQRHENKKLLRAGKHPKGTAKRTKEQDIRFCDALERILSGTSGDQQTECENVSFAKR